MLRLSHLFNLGHAVAGYDEVPRPHHLLRRGQEKRLFLQWHEILPRECGQGPKPGSLGEHSSSLNYKPQLQPVLKELNCLHQNGHTD